MGSSGSGDQPEREDSKVPKCDSNAVLTRLLELDAEGRHAALRPYVKQRLDAWSPAVFASVAVATWNAGVRTIQLALAERRRGLAGLGKLPAEIEAALAGLEGEDEPAPGALAQKLEAFEPSPETMSLDDEKLAEGAEDAMLRLEAFHRIEAVVFSSLAVSWTNPTSGIRERFAPGVDVLLRGEARTPAAPTDVWITTLTLSKHLRARGPRWVEPFALAIEERRIAPPAELDSALAQFSAGARTRAGAPTDVTTLLKSPIPINPGLYWLLVNLNDAAHGEMNRGNLRSANAISAGCAAGAHWVRWRTGGVLTDFGVIHQQASSPIQVFPLHEAAWKIAQEAGDKQSEIRALTHLADLHRLTGAPKEAQPLYEKALEISQQEGEVRLEGRALASMARFQRATGFPTRARRLLEAALEVAREVEDLQGEGAILINLALVFRNTGAPARAKARFEAALKVAREAGDRRLEGQVLLNLANLHLASGAPAASMPQCEAALTVSREIGDRRLEAHGLMSLANLHLSTGAPSQARTLCEAALSLARQVGDRRLEGQVLGRMANLHLATGAAPQARPLYEDALAIAREVGDPRLEGQVLTNMATLHQETGNPTEARTLYERVGIIFREVGDRKLEGQALANLATLHQETGNPTEARTLYETGLTIAREVGDRRFEGQVLVNLATLHRATGAPTQARTLYESTLAIAREAGDRRLEVQILGNLANLHRSTGAPAQARTLYETALAIAREAGDRRQEARGLLSLANLHHSTGAPTQARTLYETARKIAREVQEPRFEGQVLVNLAKLQHLTGAPAQARALYATAREIGREVGDRQLEGQALLDCALLHQEAGNSTKAQTLYEAALTIAREVGDRRLEGQVLIEVANLDAGAENFELARSNYEAALAIAREVYDRPGEARGLRTWARLELSLGAVEDAEKYAGRAVTLFSDFGDSSELYWAHHIHARALAEAGHPQEAHDAYRSGISVLESWLHEIGADTHRTHVLDKAFELFEDAVTFLLREAPPAPAQIAEAFDVVERTKARSLLEAVLRSGSARSIPPELIEKRRDLEGQLRFVQDAALKQEPRKEVTDILEANLASLQREHSQLLDDLAMRFPVYAVEEGLTPPLSLDQVAAKVVGTPSRALLEYFVCSDTCYVWAIRVQGTALIRLDLGHDTLLARLKQLRGAFHPPRADRLRTIFPEYLRKLSRDILDPLLPHLEGVNELLIAPSGPLHDLPFEMLVLRLPGENGWPETPPGVDRFAAPEYAADRFAIRYGPSASLLNPELRRERLPEKQRPRRQRPRVAAPRTVQVLALGNPVYDSVEPALSRAAGRGAHLAALPGTADEVAHIQKLFPETQAFLGEEARESAYRRYAPEAHLIHLGCHGLIDRDDPAYTGLVLSPDPDGQDHVLLPAYEIARVALDRMPLVVVAACDMAGGRLSASEGLLGLTRSFAEAGAGAVVAALWPIDDEATARIMAAFYDDLAAGGLDPARALAAARRAYLAQCREPGPPRRGLSPAHPVFWAGFQAQGQMAEHRT